MQAEQAKGLTTGQKDILETPFPPQRTVISVLCAHIWNWQPKAEATTGQSSKSHWCLLRLHAGCACFSHVSSSGGGWWQPYPGERARTFALTLPFPVGKWLDRAGLPRGGSVVAPRHERGLVFFPKSASLSQKSPQQPISKSVVYRREESRAASSVNTQPFPPPSRRLRRSIETILLWATAKEAVALNLLQAENKLAALPASSWPSERRFLLTPALQVVLRQDNTFKDLKTFPSVDCLSPCWLPWQSGEKPPPHAASQSASSREGWRCVQERDKAQRAVLNKSWVHLTFIHLTHLFIHPSIHPPTYSPISRGNTLFISSFPGAYCWRLMHKPDGHLCLRIRLSVCYLQSSLTLIIYKKEGGFHGHLKIA